LPDELSGSEEGFLVNLSRLPSNGPVLSVVIPVFNEKPVLPRLYERLHKALDSLDFQYEIVFVDDGSTDDSHRYLAGLAYTYPWVRLVKLSRNFGKEAATTAGLDHALGHAVIIMDADLQDPPELIPLMVEAWRSGMDIVLMRRRSRNGEGALKRFCAYMFYRLLCYMKGLFAWIGLPTKIISFDREPRAAGDSKWNFVGLMRLAMEGLTSFSVSPLRCVTFLGLLTALGSAMYGALIVAKTLIIGSDVSGYPSLMAVMTFIGGIQLLSIGLVGEYVGRIYLESKQRPIYLVEEVCELPHDDAALSRREE
jgi:glycosyltransferase involved in cell wall biosynthesis